MIHAFIKSTLHKIINKTISTTNYLILKPVEIIQSPNFKDIIINYEKKEIKEIRIEIQDMLYTFEELEKTSSGSEIALFSNAHKSLEALHKFLFYESFQNPKTFKVYESYSEPQYLREIRECRFEFLKLEMELTHV